MPDEPEVHGLLALMLLHDSRRAARFRDGELVLLADQDRSLWDASGSAGRGRACVLERALAHGRRPRATLRPVHVQAAIASLHAEEPRDWPQIAALYESLRGCALAGGRAQPGRRDRRSPGPGGGIGDHRRAGGLDEYRYFHSTRAELLRRLDRRTEARTAFEQALQLVRSEPERRFLQGRLTSL